MEKVPIRATFYGTKKKEHGQERDEGSTEDYTTGHEKW
jgi:hypothetical protein